MYAASQQPGKKAAPELDLEKGASATGFSRYIGHGKQLQAGSRQPAASSAAATGALSAAATKASPAAATGAVTAANKLRQSGSPAWHAHVEHAVLMHQSRCEQQGCHHASESTIGSASQGGFASEEVQALQTAAAFGAVWVETCIRPAAAAGSNLLRRVLIKQLFRSLCGLAGSPQHHLQPKIDTLEIVVPVFL